MNSPPVVPDFDIVLRGYDRVQVTDLLNRAMTTLAAGTGAPPHPDIPAGTPTITAAGLASAELDVVLRGFDRVQVADVLDGLARDIARLEEAGGGTAAPAAPAAEEPYPPRPQLDVVLRGYEREQVSELLDRAFATLSARTGVPAPFGTPPEAPPVTSAELASARFDVVLRGYDRVQVSDTLNDLARRIARTEAPGVRE
ncbi:hypothetical protein SUDANB121_03670 [Nocardiopsis dassonvillei]|uniref:DivIVA domain-containing protein n=1 Tax=Nocardiopsis dassonvillei TaxID=2014 RepID=UPI003F56385F